MEIPKSMRAELAAWNNGRGIDLDSWVGCEGNFRLAVGYASVYWPTFVECEGYVLRAGFSQEALRAYEGQTGIDRRAIETLMNHVHIADMQAWSCPDLTSDKALVLGSTLKEIYEAKLAWQFPDRPCRVSLHVPANPAALTEYEVTFWQRAHETPPD